jgi:uncharacterized protein with von Willebrand factor type A (vWA) domain
LFNDAAAGTDVYFLNKPPVKNICDVDRFISYLRQLTPNGYTPLNKVFNLVLNDNVNTIKEKKLLIIILTDGEPSGKHFCNLIVFLLFIFFTDRE